MGASKAWVNERSLSSVPWVGFTHEFLFLGILDDDDITERDMNGFVQNLSNDHDD